MTFSGSLTDAGVLDTHTIKWEFGDGETEEGTLTPQHAYGDNGVYTVTLTVTDDDGGIGTDTLEVAVSNVAPVAEAGPDQEVDEGSAVTFSGSLTDAGVLDTHTIEWDFGDESAATGTLKPTHAYGDNGMYTVTLKVTDDDGGVGTDTLTVTVNNMPPTVEAGADQTVNIRTVDLSGSFADPGWLDTHTAAWDFGDGLGTAAGTVEEENDEPDATGTVTGGYTYAEDGIYTATLTVTDDDEGVGTDTLKVTIDATPPITEITVGEPQYGSFVTSSTQFNLQATDNLSGVDKTEYKIDEGEWTAYTEPFALTEEGKRVVSYRSIDNVGNQEETKTLTVYVDNTPPVTTDDFENDKWFNEDITITLTATDNLSGVAETRYKLDGVESIGTTISISVEGVHEASYWSIDNLGHTEQAKAITEIKLDKTAPVVEITSPEGGRIYIAKKNLIVIRFEVTDNLDADPEINAYLKLVGQEEYVIVENGQVIEPLDIESGLWTFTVEATDHAENVTTVTTGQFEVIHDIQPPRTAIAVGDPKYGTAPVYITSATKLTLSAVDDLIEVGDGEGLGIASTSYKIDDGIWQTYNVPFAVAGEGTHTVFYKSVDIVDNAEEAKTLSVCVDNTAPVTKDNFPEDKWYNQDITITLTATDNLSGVAQTLYTINGTQAAGTTVSIATDGIYRIEYWSIDNVQNTETHKNIPQVRLDKTAPVPAAGPDREINEGDEVTFNGGSSTDNLSGIVSYTWDFGDPHDTTPGEGVNPKHVYKENGEFTVTLTVVDAAGNSAADTAKITVKNVAPAVEAGDNQEAAEGATVTFEGSFTDPGVLDTHTIKWNFGDGETATGTLKPTHAYGDNGTYTVTLTVTDDDEGVGSDTLTVTVENISPLVDAGEDLVRDEDDLITFTANFTDPGWLDTHTALWSFGDGTEQDGVVEETNDPPEGKGTVKGTHSYELPGVYTILVAVVDDDGGLHMDALKVTVQDAAPPNVALLTPSSESVGICQTVNGVIPVIGLANDVHSADHPLVPTPDNFAWYKLEYAVGKDPQDGWLLLAEGEEHVLEAATLATLDTTQLDGGYYTLRLTASELTKEDNTTKPNVSEVESVIYVGEPELLFEFGVDELNKPSYLDLAPLPDDNGPDTVRIPDGAGGIIEVEVEDTENLVMLTDSNNDCLVVYVTDGTAEGTTFIGRILVSHLPGSDKQVNLNKPKGVAVTLSETEENRYDMDVYLADRNNGRVLKITIDETLELGADLYFNKPTGIALDSEGGIYIADRGRDRVVVLDADGNFVREIITVVFNKPTGIDVAGESMYVADSNNARVLKLTKEGEIEMVVGEIGNDPGEFNVPMGVYINEARYMLVTDSNNGRVQKFDTFGNVLMIFGDDKDLPWQFNEPIGVMLSRDGSLLFVVDRNNDSVKVFGVPSE